MVIRRGVTEKRLEAASGKLEVLPSLDFDFVLVSIDRQSTMRFWFSKGRITCENFCFLCRCSCRFGDVGLRISIAPNPKKSAHGGEDVRVRKASG